ncbi:MAG: tetratricopeptide repeat protein [Terriglobia bacterium]
MTIMVGKPGCIGILLAGLLAGTSSAWAQAHSHKLDKRPAATALEARTKLGIHYGQEKEFALLWSSRAKQADALFSILHKSYPNDTEPAGGPENAQEALIEKVRVPVATESAKGVVRDEKYFRDRLDRDPQDAAALRALTDFPSTPQRCSKSIDYGRRGFALSPDDLSLELGLANSLALCRQYSEAIQHYRSYLKAQPKAEGVYFLLAQALQRSRQTAESIEVLKSLLQLNPANADARVSLGQAQAALGHYPEASAQYDIVLAAMPGNYDALQGQAYILYWTGHYNQAREKFLGLAAREPDDMQNPEALKNIGRAEEEARWVGLRPPAGAPLADFARYYHTRLESYPDDVNALKGMANTQSLLKNLPAAIQGYQHLAEKYPKDEDVRMDLARLLSRDGQHAASIKLYLEIVKVDPANAEAFRNLASDYILSGSTAEAASIYHRLSAQDPSNLGYKMEVAHLELALKHYPAAREALASVLLTDPRNHEARIGLAQLELSEGEWDAALKHFGQLLNENSEDPDALMGKARISFYQGNLQQAQLSATTLVKVRPNNADALFLLANIERARGKHRAAMALLDQAVQLNPADPNVTEMKKRVGEESPVTITTSAVYAREIGPGGPCPNPQGCGPLDLHEDLRSSEYGSTIKMHLLPRTESYLSVTSLPSESPLGRDSLGNPIPTGISGTVAPEEFLYRQSTRFNSRLAVRAGAGLVRFGHGGPVNIPGQPGQITSADSSFLAQGGLSYSLSKKISFDLDVNRSAVNYTPTSVRMGVMENRAEGRVNFLVSSRTELHLDYFYATFSSEVFRHTTNINGQSVIQNKADHDQASGTSVIFNRKIMRSSRFSFDAGFNSRIYGFAGRAQKTFLGFFNPGFYQSHLLTTRIYGNLWGPFGYDFSGGVGIQQTEHSGALTRAMILSPAITIKMNRQLSLTLGYTHYNSGQSLGNLRGNAIRVSTTFAF